MGKKLGIPQPKPNSFWGAAIRAADVCPPHTFTQYLARTCAIMYGEVPAYPPPKTVSGFIDDSRKFADYVGVCFDRLDKIAGFQLTGALRWRDRLAVLQRGTEILATGNERGLRALHTATTRYGVRLTPS